MGSKNNTKDFLKIAVLAAKEAGYFLMEQLKFINIKSNLKNLSIKQDKEAEEIIIKKIKIDPQIYLLITSGKNGAKILKNNKIICSVNGLKRKIVSTLGAGDVFLYSFIMFYNKYNSLRKSIEEANKLAADSLKYKTVEEFYKKVIV